MRYFKFILLICVSLALAEEIPQEVINITKIELKGGNLFRGFDDNKVMDGFSKTTKLSDLTIGAPFQVYVIDFKKMAASTQVSKFIKKINQWLVPLKENGKCKVFLEVTLINGNYQATCYGDNRIAIAWERILQIWPASEGFHPVYIDCSFLNYLFFHIPERGDNNLTELIFLDELDHQILSKMALNYLTNSSDVVSILQQKYSRIKSKKRSILLPAKNVNDHKIRKFE